MLPLAPRAWLYPALGLVRRFVLPRLSGLFNSSLEGNTRRAIDLHEGDDVDEEALKALIRAAVTLNTSTFVSSPSR
jgi:hypothetical protein